VVCNYQTQAQEEKVKTNWNKYADTPQLGLSDTDAIIEMAVHMSAHAADRAVTRDGKPVGITQDFIQHVIDAAENKILQLGKKFPTLIIKTRDAINIVGALSQQAGEWVFDVITVMVKKNFIPKNAWDKVINVNENHETLRSIIDRIEAQRLGKIKKLQEYAVGRKVRYHSKMGSVIEISPKKTSILVEFTDKTQKRFFVNRRAENSTLDELSMHKILTETEKKK